MFAGIQNGAGGINQWDHLRAPTALDEQTVIRMNRDTLYSMIVVDISQGATLTVPDAGDRYLSVMVINQDHYINRIFTEAGTYELTVAPHRGMELPDPAVSTTTRSAGRDLDLPSLRARRLTSTTRQSRRAAGLLAPRAAPRGPE